MNLPFKLFKLTNANTHPHTNTCTRVELGVELPRPASPAPLFPVLMSSLLCFPFRSSSSSRSPLPFLSCPFPYPVACCFSSLFHSVVSYLFITTAAEQIQLQLQQNPFELIRTSSQLFLCLIRVLLFPSLPLFLSITRSISISVYWLGLCSLLTLHSINFASH